MKFEFVFLGKSKDRYLEEGVVEYSSRLKHYTSVSIKYLKFKQKKNWTEKQLRLEEAKVLLENVPRGSLLIALDSKGKQYSSEELADRIGKWQMSGAKQVSFIIGGSVGLAETVLEEATEVLSLSKLTFTHDMVRLFLMEQIYRGFTIIRGEKYHK